MFAYKSYRYGKPLYKNHHPSSHVHQNDDATSSSDINESEESSILELTSEDDEEASVVEEPKILKLEPRKASKDLKKLGGEICAEEIVILDKNSKTFAKEELLRKFLDRKSDVNCNKRPHRNSHTSSEPPNLPKKSKNSPIAQAEDHTKNGKLECNGVIKTKVIQNGEFSANRKTKYNCSVKPEIVDVSRDDESDVDIKDVEIYKTKNLKSECKIADVANTLLFEVVSNELVKFENTDIYKSGLKNRKKLGSFDLGEKETFLRFLFKHSLLCEIANPKLYKILCHRKFLGERKISHYEEFVSLLRRNFSKEMSKLFLKPRDQIIRSSICKSLRKMFG